MDKKKIMFVCEGNSCRSPMAKAIFSKLLFERFGAKASGYIVDSSGLRVVLPGPTAEAQKVMENMGVNISNYATKQFDPNYAKEFDYIITMTQRQKNEIINLTPNTHERVYLLGEFSNDKNNMDISDPFGGNIEIYTKCANKIMNLLKEFINTLE